MVRAGVEPAPAKADNILSVACIPIPPPDLLEVYFTLSSIIVGAFNYFGGVDNFSNLTFFVFKLVGAREFRIVL